MAQWSKLNGLCLNVKKCKIMSFSRKNNYFKVNYLINDQQLERCETFNDLGVRFDPKLSFIPHIDNIISKASSRLGMIKRWAKELNDPYVTKSLFIGLVRSVLEFACQVWNPSYAIHIIRIESIQKKFLLFALQNLNWENRFILPPYKQRLLLLDMNTLENRREVLSSIFVYNVIVSKIDSNFLLHLIDLYVPYRNLRNFIPVRQKFYILNYLNNEPFSYCINHFNNLFQFVDFNLSVNTIKHNMLIYFKRSLQLTVIQ